KHRASAGARFLPISSAPRGSGEGSPTLQAAVSGCGHEPCPHSRHPARAEAAPEAARSLPTLLLVSAACSLRGGPVPPSARPRAPVHPRLGLHVRARAGGAGNHHRGEGGGGDAEAAPVGSVSTLRHAARRLGVSRVRGPAVRAQRALPPLRGLQGARAAAPEEARQGLSSAEGGSAGSAGAGAGPPPAQGRPEVQRR
ncbi:unnamed protein product, partial [Prorocentrum cordatum]